MACPAGQPTNCFPKKITIVCDEMLGERRSVGLFFQQWSWVEGVSLRRTAEWDVRAEFMVGRKWGLDVIGVLSAMTFLSACQPALGPSETGRGSSPTPMADHHRPSAQMRPVVAVRCDKHLQYCRDIVQALSESSPGFVYRINPSPLPPNAFQVTVLRDNDGAGYLEWRSPDEDGANVRSRAATGPAAMVVAQAQPDLARALLEFFRASSSKASRS